MKIARKPMLSMKVISLIAILAILSLLISILYYNDPSLTKWSPKCAIHYITGYQCPSCGGQRFLYSILHGNIGNAFKYNMFLTIALPYVLILSITHLFQVSMVMKIRNMLENKYAVYTYLFLYITWGITRNILNI